MINNLHSLLKNPDQNKYGFSLIELLIYMGLSMIILSIVSSLLVSIFNVRSEAEKTSSVEQDGRYIISRLIYDVNRAQDITLPVNLGDNSTSLQLTIEGNTVTYQVISDKLFMTDSTGSYALNNKEIDTTTFDVTRLGNSGGKNGVEINLETVSQIESEGKLETRDYNFFVAIR